MESVYLKLGTLHNLPTTCQQSIWTVKAIREEPQSTLDTGAAFMIPSFPKLLKSDSVFPVLSSSEALTCETAKKKLVKVHLYMVHIIRTSHSPE